MDPSSEAVGTDTLYAIIGAIAAGPDLAEVLRAVVALLVDATGCHACFVYLRDGDQLTIRAASPIFEHIVDRVTLSMGEGLTGWVARNRTPAFIREAAFEDPRMKYVPELDEDRFQSMVAVPFFDRHGDVIGVVVLHTEAPREFGQDVLDLLVHVASLVAGAIDSARLHEKTQQQVAALSALASLSQDLASLTSRSELFVAGCEGIRALLGAERCSLTVLDARGGVTEVAATPISPEPTPKRMFSPLAEGRLTAELVDADRRTGTVSVTRSRPFTDEDGRLLQTAANQLALALRTAGRIEVLARDNDARQVFDALEHGNPSIAASKAVAAGWDTTRSHVVVVGEPAAGAGPGWLSQLGPEVARSVRSTAAGALVDLAPERVRALIAVSDRDAASSGALGDLHRQLAALGEELNMRFGISQPRTTFAGDAASIAEADSAARITAALNPRGGAHAYAELGAYRFLVDLIGEAPPDARHAIALAVLADYDRQRRSALIDTLDAYLEARGASQRAAELLVIHPNTLRQRIERIEHLTDLELSSEDLLSLHLSLKLHRLQASARDAEARENRPPSTAPHRRVDGP